MTKKALSLTEFLNLPQEVQFRDLQAHGVYVGKRKVDGKTVVLFQLHAFYVEVYYRQYRKIVDHIRTSADTDILQPYLKQINMGGLDEGTEKK